MCRNLFSSSTGKIVEKLGGRDRDRTGDPLLAKQTGKTLKALSGVAYTGNWRNFRSLKCPEVVPNFSAPLELPNAVSC
jgi:hypothetical protein